MNRVNAQRIAWAVVPRSGEIDSLVQAVSTRIGRPIAITECDLPLIYSGIWVGDESGDIIKFDPAAPEATRQAAICHELAHILLGHEPHNILHSAGALFKHIDPSKTHAIRVMHRSVYDEPPEHDAEVLATSLLERLRVNRATRIRSLLH